MNRRFAHAEWYWLTLSGPDGRVIMLGKFSSRWDGFMLPDWSEEYLPLCEGNRLHKWTLLFAELARPYAGQLEKAQRCFEFIAKQYGSKFAQGVMEGRITEPKGES